MEDAIVAKLSALLSQGITTEAELVYLLVEVRKLYERRNAELPPCLKLFCDWVVHAKLDNPKWAKQATDLKDKLIASEEFRRGLTSVLKRERLPEPDDWPGVLQLLAAVLKDCPLEFHELGPRIKGTVAPDQGDYWAVRFQLAKEPRRRHSPASSVR